MKTMKQLLAVVLVLIFCVSVLTACGGGVSGKYVLSEAPNDDGKLVKVADLVKEMKDFYDEMEWDYEDDDFDFYYDVTIEFLKDNKFIMSAGGEENEGTYEVSGKDITLTNPDGPNDKLKGKIDGNKITFDNEDFKMVFVKK